MLSDARRNKLTRLFNLRDVNDNGVLTREDYEATAQQIAKVLEWKEGSEMYNMMVEAQLFGWQRMMEFADDNDNQQITLDEYLASYENMKSTDEMYDNVEQTIQFAFGWFDKDDNGYIKADEYVKFLSIFNVTEATARAAFEKVDDQNSGKLSKDNFRDRLTEFFLSDEADVPGNHFFGGYVVPLEK